MDKLTQVTFSIECESGVKFGAFAIDQTSPDSINVEEVFHSLQDQQLKGIKIKYDLIPEKSKDECDKDGIDQLNSKKKVEDYLKESLAFLQKLDNPDT